MNSFIIYSRIIIGFLSTLAAGVFTYTCLRYLMLQWVTEEQTNVNMGLIGLVVFIIAIFYGGYWMSARKIRDISIEEYETMRSRNLIHFSYHPLLSGQTTEGSGIVKLYASQIDIPSGQQALVWFHLSDEMDQLEPLFQSYWDNHYVDTKPFSKTIIPLKAIPFERIKIRPQDHSIAVKGDVEVQGYVYTSFTWYNHKIYFLPTLRYSIVSFLAAIIIIFFRIPMQIWKAIMAYKKSLF